MTVRAAHVALGDLSENERPRLPHDEQRDLGAFGGLFTMVELEGDYVRLATVNAGMHTQVVMHALSIRVTPLADPVDLAGDVLRTVS
jgi:hypothetical protein